MLHLQRASRAPELYAYLYASTSARLQRGSRAPEPHTSTSPHLRRASQAPEPHASTSARLQHTSRAPELLRQTPRPHTYITPPELHSSTPTRLQRTSRAPELHSSTPTRPQRASQAPGSIPLHLYVYMPAGGLQSSIPLLELISQLFTPYHFGPPCAGRSFASTSILSRLRTCGASPALRTPIPRHRYTYIQPPELHTFIPPC